MSQIPVVTVSELTRCIKEFLEGTFPAVCVQGEISNCSRAGSGHIYLTLKDDDAQIRAVIWRSTAARFKFEVEDGLAVVATGPIEVYEARGTYQLIVERLIPQGMGALELAFRQLHDRLAAEGLFDVERKRPLPRFPKRVALITSPSGAAVRDMIQVISRRWTGTDIVILPVAVQGVGAAQEIAGALNIVHRIPGVEVVITGRGGGSLEDLWAFNEEIVARAIFACRIPVISAVGHEIDVSISDLVADRRALTPSEAGELVVPHRNEVQAEFDRLRQRMLSALRRRATEARARIDAFASRRVFRRPLDRIQDLAHRLDELHDRLRRASSGRLELARQKLGAVSGALDALSPLGVLSRGYSITRTKGAGAVIKDAGQLNSGDEIETILNAGRVISRVEEIEPPDDQ